MKWEAGIDYVRAGFGEKIPRAVMAQARGVFRENPALQSIEIVKGNAGRAMKGEPHRQDADCDVDPADDLCRVCHIYHGEPCLDCGRRAYHRTGCEDEDAPVSRANCLVFPFSPDEPTACGMRLEYEPPPPGDLWEAAKIAGGRAARWAAAGKVDRARHAAFAAWHLARKGEGR